MCSEVLVMLHFSLREGCRYVFFIVDQDGSQSTSWGISGSLSRRYFLLSTYSSEAISFRWWWPVAGVGGIVYLYSAGATISRPICIR